MATLSEVRIRALWISFKNDFKDSRSLSHTQSFYNGYAFALFRAKLITHEQYIGIRQRIMENINWTENKRNLRF